MAQRPPLILPLTEARTQLFRLAEDVLTGKVDRVRLTHRGQVDDLLLMRASTVAQLEREVADLRSRVAPTVRSLAGLGALLVTDEELIRHLAAANADLAAAADVKHFEITRGLTYPIIENRHDRVAEATASQTPRSGKRTVKPKPRG
jgi:hypothetical protein